MQYRVLKNFKFLGKVLYLRPQVIELQTENINETRANEIRLRVKMGYLFPLPEKLEVKEKKKKIIIDDKKEEKEKKVIKRKKRKRSKK